MLILRYYLVLVNCGGCNVNKDIQKAVEHFGSKAKMADALKVSRAAVSHWIKAQVFPPARAIQIEALTKGEIKALDLVVEVSS
jgi:DNA-binding transcriptional regulator YdaS (Cro superfamily)